MNDQLEMLWKEVIVLGRTEENHNTPIRIVDL